MFNVGAVRIVLTGVGGAGRVVLTFVVATRKVDGAGFVALETIESCAVGSVRTVGVIRVVLGTRAVVLTGTGAAMLTGGTGAAILTGGAVRITRDVSGFSWLLRLVDFRFWWTVSVRGWPTGVECRVTWRRA
jgi:hypothetical protein